MVVSGHNNLKSHVAIASQVDNNEVYAGSKKRVKGLIAYNIWIEESRLTEKISEIEITNYQNYNGK